MKYLFAILLTISVGVASADEPIPDSQSARYQISEGKMLVTSKKPDAGEEQKMLTSVPVSILLDTQTGKSWILVVETTGQWARVQFSGQVKGKEFLPHD